MVDPVVATGGTSQPVVVPPHLARLQEQLSGKLNALQGGFDQIRNRWETRGSDRAAIAALPEEEQEAARKEMWGRWDAADTDRYTSAFEGQKGRLETFLTERNAGLDRRAENAQAKFEQNGNQKRYDRVMANIDRQREALENKAAKREEGIQQRFDKAIARVEAREERRANPPEWNYEDRVEKINTRDEKLDAKAAEILAKRNAQFDRQEASINDRIQSGKGNAESLERRLERLEAVRGGFKERMDLRGAFEDERKKRFLDLALARKNRLEAAAATPAQPAEAPAAVPAETPAASVVA